jgi:hypothetical protein
LVLAPPKSPNYFPSLCRPIIASGGERF